MWIFPNAEPWVWGDRTYLMGVLNVTPDSFSDGGEFAVLEAAIAQAHHLAINGADLLDVGGESARPNAAAVSLDDEMQRVIPVIQAIRQGTAQAPPLTIPISIDTTKAAIARAAVQAGATIVNDVSGATYDPDMLTVVAELGVPLVLMHLRGTPKTMQQLTDYGDVVQEVGEFLQQRIEAAIAAGVSPHHIAIDPGIGFAKTPQQSLELLRRLPELKALGYPVLVGVSRKSFLGKVLDQPDPKQRLWGTAAACTGAIAAGADILRVHDLPQLWDVARVADAIWRHRP
ncbi:MAG: dihydropteroate synthase [Kaiparowitsia implicata GSE-PSE-MK54-09C]|jgi:dihydropteroate synthase|nr:dihydropteroate synthase [Kaiparowitsia implicata GSE-PSE-MK54-09C]